MKEKATSRGRERQRGQTIILVAIGLVSLLAMAALAIDVVTLYAARSETQRAADAAALVAAKAIADSGFTTLPPTDPHILDNSAQLLAQHMATAAINAMLTFNNPPINPVAGKQPNTGWLLGGAPTISFPATANPPNSNPYITVKLQVTGLPLFFARIFGNRTAIVTTSATAEAYNPANVAAFTPIAPKGVKPWLVANADPTQPPGTQFINTLGPTWTVEPNVIGEQFYLHSDCQTANFAQCSPLMDPTPGIPASSNGGHPQVDYVPAMITTNAGANVCPSTCLGATDYERSIECADMTTSYQVLSCGGGTNNAQWDNTVNPGGLGGLSDLGTECLINATAPGNNKGQDTIFNPGWPSNAMQITAQSGPQNGNVVTTSSSIVTIPIIDTTPPFPATGGAVQIDGYLQAFINEVHGGGNPAHQGDIQITVLNIAGCTAGGATGATPVIGSGSSPVPVRLITPP
jgi:hypothetical protein